MSNHIIRAGANSVKLKNQKIKFKGSLLENYSHKFFKLKVVTNKETLAYYIDAIECEENEDGAISIDEINHTMTIPAKMLKQIKNGNIRNTELIILSGEGHFMIWDINQLNVYRDNFRYQSNKELDNLKL